MRGLSAGGGSRLLSSEKCTICLGPTHPVAQCVSVFFPGDLLTPNVNYSGRTAPLTSKVAFHIFIQQI